MTHQQSVAASNDRWTGPTPPAGRSRTLGCLAGVVSRMAPIDLPAVMQIAGLQSRTERKYLLAPEEFTRLTEHLPEQFRVLEIDQRRIFNYQSIYFDTAERDLFRSHRQGRRRRYKVRSRTYLDSGQCMFEVKLKGYRGQTVKHRLPHPAGDRFAMTPEAQDFAATVLDEEYGLAAPALRAALSTSYRRSTLVDPVNGARLTCDVDLVTADNGHRRSGPELVLVESKSAEGPAIADLELKQMGIRPVSLSKYCIGTALLDPHLPANRWNRILRESFGWAPA